MGIFDMRPIAGGVEGKTFKKFEELRKLLREQNIKYNYYFKSKYSTVRVLVEVFTYLNKDFLELLGKLEGMDVNDGDNRVGGG